MVSKEGCMFVAKGEDYFETMKDDLDVFNIFFESTVVRHAELACNDFLDDRCIVLADYCTADGKLAIDIFKQMIALIRSKEKSKEVMLIFEDKMENDYNKLLRNVLQDGILSSNGIFALASSVSMFNQCLPSASVHFIFSAFGTHYLSKRPCNIKAGMLTFDADEKEKEALSTQAAIDWQCFLCHRSKELVEGGCMFLIVPCKGPWTGFRLMTPTLNSIFNDNIISKKEYTDIMINSYFRDEDELRRPFIEFTGTNLEIVSLNIVGRTIFKAVDGAIKVEDADKITRIIKTVSCQSLINNLDSSRTDSEKENIAAEFYRRLLPRVLGMTDDFKYHIAEIVLQKCRVNELHEAVCKGK